MSHWIQALLSRLEGSDAGAVRVSVAAVRGSAPREAGAWMLVGRDWQDGTIGGGHLELLATRIAREMLAEATATRLDLFSLGATLGQCCGGAVELWFERFTAEDQDFLGQVAGTDLLERTPILATALETAEGARHRLLSVDEARLEGADLGSESALLLRGSNVTLFERLDSDATPLWLFGAGHVGRALVNILATLPFEVTWIDSRDDVFEAALPANVRTLLSPEPADELASMPAHALALVMTHSHDQDFAICQALLNRGAFRWAGLIGSGPKARRFAQRLTRRGFSAAQIERIVTPIGIGAIRSKDPAAIAVSVAAQLLQVREAMQAGTQAGMAAAAG